MNRRAATCRKFAELVPGALVLATLAALVVLERRRPLRTPVEPGRRREARNLTLAMTTAIALRIAEKPLVESLAEAVERRRWGLLQQCRLPRAVEAILALLLLDYTLYLWHILTHRVPLLWRFHLVHHVDLDLSASTGLRFHFAEMLLSVPWRAAQVLLLGVRRRFLVAWQTATLVEILFHHSNLRLPRSFEEPLERLLVTPRLHGIHHSCVAEETASNWSSGLTLWDRLHGTLRRDAPQRRITIGVPAYRDPGELTLPRLLAMPFAGERPAWQPHPPRVGAPQPEGEGISSS